MIVTRQFGMADQVRFASLSGDCNPLHMDPVAARRSAMGAPIVHGIHGVLWALEALCAEETLAINRIAASFSGPIYVGDTASVTVVRRKDDEIKLAIAVEGTPATSLTIGLGAPGAAAALDAGEVRPADWPSAPLELGVDAVRTQRGAFVPADDQGACAADFPALCAAIGVVRVQGLAALSRLVGMISPGLHSIFHSFAVNLVEPAEAVLAYSVSELDERFRLARMPVSGCGIEGDVSAFVRLPPIVQPTISEIAAGIARDAYAGATVLVIGGSRGLGEVAAKACAAGGARVIVTYAVGEAEALRVAEEIRGFGGSCDVLRFDARAEAAPQLAALPAAPTHLYYFATGPIAMRKTRFLSPDVLADLMRIYGTAFAEACEALAPIKAFYPSSIAVEEAPKGWTEYAMAKAAGEVLAANMTLRLKGVEVVVERLPRILTDQTASLLSADAAPVQDVILPIVQHMQG